MFRAFIACFMLFLVSPVLADWRVIDTSKAVKSIKLAGKVMTCQGANIVIDNTQPSEGAGTPGTRQSSRPQDGTIILNLKMMKRLAPATQWFIFGHECGHLFGLKVTESRADRYGTWKGIDEGWLTEADLKGVCDSFEDAPAIYENGKLVYPSGRQRCKNIKGWFVEFDAKQKAYEAKLKEYEATQKKAEELAGAGEVEPEVKKE
jgi:hypothetical protein